MGNHATKSESETMKEIEERVIALEIALEALLKKAEEQQMNLHGGDGEWFC